MKTPTIVTERNKQHDEEEVCCQIQLYQFALNQKLDMYSSFMKTITKKGTLPSMLQRNNCIWTTRGIVTTAESGTNVSKPMMKHTNIIGDNATSDEIC